MSHPVISAFSHYVFQRCNFEFREGDQGAHAMTDEAKAGVMEVSSVTPPAQLNPISAGPTPASTLSATSTTTTTIVNAIVHEVTKAASEVTLVSTLFVKPCYNLCLLILEGSEYQSSDNSCCC